MKFSCWFTVGFKGSEQKKHEMLVGGFNHLEKYESQLGLLFPIYMEK